MQIVISALFLIIFAAVGFLSPANRGSLMIGMLLIFSLLGAVAGFTSARLYKTFKVFVMSKLRLHFCVTQCDERS